MTVLQVALLVVFTINFVWIALPFVNGLIGFLALWGGRGVSGITLPPLPQGFALTTRTALLMPIYNEAPQHVFARLQAIYESLDALGVLDHFALFILSDTTDPDLWLEEEAGFWELRRRTKGERHIFYRHRLKNIRRKAGNIADFCQRWGAQYDHMVVLDADSLMTGQALVQLVAAMEASRDTGLIQTLPFVVNRQTLFARAHQFAARIYGPVLATGLAYWHLGDSNYWGHNAIIRTKAFIDHAGLPDLPGQPPFGGPIMSHDFVEAALLRRAGWKVYLVPEITGSYEENPPSLLAFAERDRRWCQGNLQHSRVVSAAGLHWLSRSTRSWASCRTWRRPSGCCSSSWDSAGSPGPLSPPSLLSQRGLRCFNLADLRSTTRFATLRGHYGCADSAQGVRLYPAVEGSSDSALLGGSTAHRDGCPGRDCFIIADRAGYDADAVGRGAGHCDWPRRRLEGAAPR
jgi:membrane glycosyltransferase